MAKFNTRKLVITSAMTALTVVMAVTPLGYLPWFGGASLVIIHIPTILAAVLEGPIAGTIVGLAFGLSSMIKAATAPVGPLDFIFANPVISVLPRLLIAVCAWGVYKLFRNKFLPLAAFSAGLAGSIANTVFVLFALWAVAAEEMAAIMQLASSALPAMLLGIALSNGIIEALTAAFFTSAVLIALKGLDSYKKRSRLAKEK